MQRSPGLRPLDQLKVGLDELQWMQAEIEKHGRNGLLGLAYRTGLVIHRQAHGLLNLAWSGASLGGGQLALRRSYLPAPRAAGVAVAVPTVAVDGNGRLFGFGPEADFYPGDVIPDDSTWYTVLVEAADVQIEPGTIEVFAGTPNVTGTDTDFTRYAGKTTDGFGRGSKIRIDAADTAAGNSGIFEVDTVIDATHLTLVQNIPGGNEAGVQCRIAGDFLAAVPADPDCHSIRSVAVTVVAALRETGDLTRFPVCDVRRTGAALELVDRREQSLYSPIGASYESVEPTLGVTSKATVLDYELTRHVRDLGTPGAGAIKVTACPIHPLGADPTPQVLVAGTLAGGGALETWTRHLSHFDVAIAPVAVEAAGVDRAALVRLPFENRIALVYGHGNKVKLRLTTDNGATWGAAVTLMDPTLNDALDSVEHPHVMVMSNGRILVSFEYDDNSLGFHYIAGVYSDDYGDNWVDNGGVGYRLSNVTWGANAHAYPYVAQGRDGYLWLAAEDGANQIVFSKSDPSGMLGGGWSYGGGGEVMYSPSSATGELYDPAIWCAPNGQVVVFPTDYAPGVFDGIAAGVVSTRPGGDTKTDFAAQSWMVEEVGIPSANRHSPWVVQLPNGQLWLCYVNTANLCKAQLVHIERTPLR